MRKNLSEIQQALDSLKEDEALPKNIKAKIDEISIALNDESDLSVKIGKSLHTLDEISEDLNMPAFLRTQVWNISSMLEKLNH